MKADFEERAERVAEARRMVEEAMEMVNDAVYGLDIEKQYEAYGRFGFDQLLGNGNPYDGGLGDVIEGIRVEGDAENKTSGGMDNASTSLQREQ